MATIFLTGFMGTGKTSVGIILAEMLAYEFIDLDEVIEKQAGMSITTLFHRYGETYFRNLETASLKQISSRERIVLSMGGGVVLAEKNRQILHKDSIVINLTASVESIIQRLQNNTDRPLLQADRSPERIVGMLATREQFYADADLRIITDNKSAADIAKNIKSWLEQKGFV